jgi:murein DD-endopeptidase MepM/ murein hydrolase activator NlpD
VEEEPEGERHPRPDRLPAPLTPSVYGPGPYSNAALVLDAEKLKTLGRSERFVMRHAYAPFIIGGPADWTNGWGALRHDPDGTTRRHLGQDVFCELGDPVLAAVKGTVEFSSDRLGGTVARLNRPDGTYFYYAHLDAWNDREFSSGDAVRPGDVIGFCGATGNASGSAPHVHFGYYAGDAQDPMGFLLRWLRRAELGSAAASDPDGVAALTLSRRFGDDLVPGADSISGDVVSESIEVLVDAAIDERG